MTWTYPYYACAAGLDPVAGDMRTDHESMIMIDYCASLNSSLTEEIGIKLSLESESNPKWLSFHRGEGGWQSWLAGARARAVGCGLWVVAVGSGSEGKRSFYM